MADNYNAYAPPSGPPPPRVPEGWKAVWNDQYKEWFYVNLLTEQSTWERPTEPASHIPHSRDSHAPPSYDNHGVPMNAGTDHKMPLESNNPYSHDTKETDEALARRLQEEENARNRGSSNTYHETITTGGAGAHYPGASDYNNPHASTSLPGSADRSHSKGGFLDKIKEKLKNPQPGGNPMMGRPMIGYGAGGYPPQQQGYGGYPQQGYGGYPQQGHGGYGHNPMMGGGMGGLGGLMGGGHGGMYGRPARKPGMGAGGAAALGVGGGLMGGMMLANAMDDDDYSDGGGGDYGGDDGGDDGGGD